MWSILTDDLCNQGLINSNCRLDSGRIFKACYIICLLQTLQEARNVIIPFVKIHFCKQEYVKCEILKKNVYT